MQNNSLLLLHKHSWAYIAASFAVGVLLLMLDLELLALAAFGFALLSAYVFRNPQKLQQNFEKDAVLSPVDGTVVSVEEIEDAAFGYKVVVESSYFDISMLRAPVNASVIDIQCVKGTRVAKESKLFYDLNEHGSVTFEDEANRSVKIEHRLTRSFAPLFIDVLKYEAVEKGAQYGIMLTGETTIYLPKSFKLSVNAASKLSASETLLGYFL